MIKSLKRIAVIAVILAVVLGASYSILDACAAVASCGAWCETFGDCLGNEKCIAGIGFAMCTCGNSSAVFGCTPAR